MKSLLIVFKCRLLIMRRGSQVVLWLFQTLFSMYFYLRVFSFTPCSQCVLSSFPIKQVSQESGHGLGCVLPVWPHHPKGMSLYKGESTSIAGSPYVEIVAQIKCDTLCQYTLPCTWFLVIAQKIPDIYILNAWEEKMSLCPKSLLLQM